MKIVLQCRLAAAILTVTLLGGCGGLLPAAPPAPAQFAIDQRAAGPAAAATAREAARATIVVGTPRAAAGYDSSRMIYLRQPHQLEYFAYHQWVDPPAQMLGPLVADALEATAAFKAVLLGASGASGEWRLEIELLRLQQEFTASPSRVQVALRAQLIDSRSRRVAATRVIEASEPAASDDPYGGVVAANQAVARAVGELAGFVAETMTATTVSAPAADAAAPPAAAAAAPPRAREATGPASPRSAPARRR